MRLLVKVILVFLIVFNFIVPVVKYSVTVAVILATLYYLVNRRSIPFTYFLHKYVVFIMIGTIALVFVNLAILIIYASDFFLMIRRLLLQLYMLCSLVYCLPILIEDKSKAWQETIQVVCFAFTLQGMIHLTGFLFPPIGEWLFEIKPEDFKETVLDPVRNIDKFRGYALAGSIFFELPAAYGVACFLFFRLQLMKDQDWITGWKSYIVILFLLIGIALSGRTGFVGFFIALGLYLLLAKNKIMLIVRNIWKYILIGICIVVVTNFLISPQQRKNFEDELFPFAFEAYYNYKKTGDFTTGSTDALQERHYFRLSEETILKGHGIMSIDTKMYPNTDSGYLNNLIFGGIFYYLCLIIYQSLYFIDPLRRSYVQGQKGILNIDFIFFTGLFVYMLILEYKAVTLGTQHITEVLLLYAGISFLISHYETDENQS